MMREGTSGDAGYKRWPGKVGSDSFYMSMQAMEANVILKEYDPEDLKGQAEPSFSLDRAFKAHRIDEDGIEMDDRAGINREYHAAERKGTLDARDPVEIAGNDGKYAEAEMANYGNNDTVRRTGSIRAAGDSLKRRIGSMRHRKNDD